MKGSDGTGSLSFACARTLDGRTTGIGHHIIALHTLEQTLFQGFDVPPVGLARCGGKIPVPRTHPLCAGTVVGE